MAWKIDVLYFLTRSVAMTRKELIQENNLIEISNALLVHHRDCAIALCARATGFIRCYNKNLYSRTRAKRIQYVNQSKTDIEDEHLHVDNQIWIPLMVLV
mmetsp:Transcript_16153/g.39514  ORF Transcript_16153/g.39514 Transcript_16153/m.39514 type:complete len:100 (-) Transcript_16153:3-302(-)